MKNKGIVNGELHDQPCFYAFTLPENDYIYWVVPFSSRTDKFHKILYEKIEKYHKCDTIVFDEVSGREKAFLNMCPVTPKYINLIYIDSRAKLPVKIEHPLANKKVKSVSRISYGSY